jgi:hypothetical protein
MEFRPYGNRTLPFSTDHERGKVEDQIIDAGRLHIKVSAQASKAARSRQEV